MITTDQKQAAENAASGAMVQVREAHLWPSIADCTRHGFEPKQFYHVVSGDYRTGSTVTIPTLLALGLRVEVVE